jgi:hypothetical protein
MQLKQLLLVFLCGLAMAMKIGAQEYTLQIPSSFETEVCFKRMNNGQFEPSQYSLSKIQYQDFRNYRVVSRNASTIKPEFLQDGMNLKCGESETIVIDGRVLSVQRQTPDFFQGEVPNNPETLNTMVDERCQDCPWTVRFSTDYEKHSNVYRIEGLGSIIGKQDFLNLDRTAFSIAKKSILRSSEDSLESNITIKGDLHRLVLQKWEGGWRVSELVSNYRNPPLTMKYLIKAQGDSLESEIHGTKTSNAPETKINARMTNIQFDSRISISLARSIANGTPVSLDGSPQIKAVWMDGKVVRVYEGGTVDDLGSATFRTNTASFGIAKTLLITLGFACVGSLFMWIRRSRAKVKLS